MRAPSRSSRAFRPSLSFALFALFLAILWLAGGASQPDVPGQVVVRGASWAMLAAAILFGPRISVAGRRGIWTLLALTVLLPALQLVPLPPSVWQALPGRGSFHEAAAASGQVQPWRPLSITPAATVNALGSLIVPTVTLVLLSGLTADERRKLPALALTVLTASMLIGLFQFSGAGIANPFIKDEPGEIAGSFANRNHFALFMALGCVIAPVWAFPNGRQPAWRAPIAISLVVIFTLMVIATGSRAGLLTETLALCLALAIVWRPIARSLRHYPRWMLPAVMTGIVGVLATVILVSVALDRAASVSRIMGGDGTADRRARAFSTITGMISEYFPAGAGIGGFDPIFRLHEPFQLLEFTYLNHAHDDLLEIALDAGLPGLLLLLGALCWFGIKSWRAWFVGSNGQHIMPRLGSAILLLIVVGSAFDYPARTPMMMAWIVMAAVWLGEPLGGEGRRQTLPLER